MKHANNWTNQRLEIMLSRLLQIGVLTAAIVVLIGGIGYLLKFGLEKPAYSVFKGEPAEYRSIVGIITGVFSLHFRSIIQLGLLLLIATPIARVLFSLVAFFLQKDYIYVVITFLVFGILMFSLVWGR